MPVTVPPKFLGRLDYELSKLEAQLPPISPPPPPPTPSSLAERLAKLEASMAAEEYDNSRTGSTLLLERRLAAFRHRPR